MNQKKIFIVAVVALVLLFIAGMAIYASQKDKQATQQAEANRAVLMRMHSPTLGRAEAPVVIVEFFDPACETCRAFIPRLKR